MVAEIQRGHHLVKPLAWYKSLHTAKGRSSAGVFLIEGHKAIAQIHSTHPECIQEVLVDESQRQPAALNVPVRNLTHKQFSGIALSKTPQGVIGVVTIPANAASDILPQHPGAHIVLLEEVQDPGNVGTLIRTAAAFGFSGVLLSDTSADPFASKTVQASAGALLSVWIRRTKRYHNVLRQLQQRGYCLIAADTRGASHEVFDKRGKIVLMLGSEGKGLSQQVRAIADEIFTIPFRADAVESLNVGSAGAIGMFLASRAHIN